MNDQQEHFEDGRAEPEEALAALRRADRVDFALRIAQSLRDAGAAARPLALAFQDTVTSVARPESAPDAAKPADD